MPREPLRPNRSRASATEGRGNASQASAAAVTDFVAPAAAPLQASYGSVGAEGIPDGGYEGRAAEASRRGANCARAGAALPNTASCHRAPIEFGWQ
ncbi:hypothetical protein EJB05_19596, partial [Eragrostis curvula]